MININRGILSSMMWFTEMIYTATMPVVNQINDCCNPCKTLAYQTIHLQTNSQSVKLWTGQLMDDNMLRRMWNNDSSWVLTKTSKQIIEEQKLTLLVQLQK